MSVQLDLTESVRANTYEYTQGFYIKAYRDGDVLVKVFEGDEAFGQIESFAWLSHPDAVKLRDFLNENL